MLDENRDDSMVLPDEYFTLDRTFSEAVLDSVDAWIRSRF
jgi:hypothetical protein